MTSPHLYQIALMPPDQPYDLAHGEFGKWLESIDMDRRRAAEFIKVYEELSSSNVRTLGHIGFRALYEIATLPPDQRDKPHTGEVKSDDLAHGEYIEWLGTVGFDRTTAHRFVKVYEEFGSNVDTWQQIGMKALYEIATLPPEQREKPHVIPSTGEVKSVHVVV